MDAEWRKLKGWEQKIVQLGVEKRKDELAALKIAPQRRPQPAQVAPVDTESQAIATCMMPFQYDIQDGNARPPSAPRLWSMFKRIVPNADNTKLRRLVARCYHKTFKDNYQRNEDARRSRIIVMSPDLYDLLVRIEESGNLPQNAHDIRWYLVRGRENTLKVPEVNENPDGNVYSHYYPTRLRALTGCEFQILSIVLGAENANLDRLSRCGAGHGES